MKRTLVALSIACATTLSAFADVHKLPFAMVDHLNIVLSTNQADKVHDFYGEVLGLKRIPDLNFPGKLYMIRYMGGKTEVKFIVYPSEMPNRTGGTRTARGIRLMAFMMDSADMDSVTQRIVDHGFPKPTFNRVRNFYWGMTNDHDGNQVELVFIDDITDEKKNEFQIGLTVTDQAEMRTFLRDILGLEELNDNPLPDGGFYHRNGVGNSVIKYWTAKTPDLPAHVGPPGTYTGMNLVQFLVADVDAVRAKVLERGGTIHTEPFALGKLATIMFVEGPDGILFEFAGPLLERLKK